MTRVALSASSDQALAVGAGVAARGGGSVDVAIAAAIAAMVTEPGICAPGAGGFVSVGGLDTEPVVYDGYVAMPGIGSARTGGTTFEALLDYGGGITTLVGPASIATPGGWAALEMAHREHGRHEWLELIRPTTLLARNGFPLGPTSRYYLERSHEEIFDRDPASRAALHPHGHLAEAGELISMPDLADSLELIGKLGAECLYRGELGAAIAADLQARGGLLTNSDLACYEAVRRPPINTPVGSFLLATNPEPAVGGVALVMLLELILAGKRTVAEVVESQRRVFEWRKQSGESKQRRNGLRSPSTVHISAVDEAGLGCAITLSAGYGSGVIPAGTGMWMNNALGERELVGEGFSTTTPGQRLTSNMAPSVATSNGGEVLAIGSPGASRITTAMAQTLIGYCVDGLNMESAVAAPRVHLELEPHPQVAAEPGVELEALDLPVHAFDALHMFFGGVGVARRSADGTLEATSDPRRNGAAAIVG